MKARTMFVSSALTLLVAPAALAQSAASNKAFFAKDTAGIVFAPVSGAGFSAPITLISVPAAVKTSSGGALSATLSMESLLSHLQSHDGDRQRRQELQQLAGRDQGVG
jgi:hypothetical protein